ncbi:MAG: hypothetical protein K2W92_00625, partial [Alphaproteobacteria bacterium]|nr:hypothetical protein [Alphaproteobacteria bacterium]
MKNLTDNYLGMGELPCRDNIVYLLGKTGAGKSTFLNYIAGKSFSATKDGLETIIKMDDPIAEIGHGSISKTFKPTLWKQEKTGNLPLCYYDTPGLSDNRGAAYDIIKAFFLQSLGNEVNSLRIILLAEEDSLVDKRGQGFVELATDLEKLVGKEGIKRLYDTTSLIITKSKHSLSDIRREIEKKVKDFKSEEVRGLFQALLDKKRIKNLKKIEEGNYSSGQALGEETPATYEVLIRSTTPITPYFLDSQNQNRSLFNIVVSSDTFRTIVECSDFFNNNIKKAVGNLGENIQAHYANLLKEQMPLNDTIVKSWHTSWKNLRDQELKNLSIETPQGLLNRLTENVKKNNITDTSQRNTTLVLKTLKQQGDYLSFFKKIPEMVTQYLTDSWIAGLAPLVNNLEQLEKIHSNGTYFQTERNTTLVIKGYFPKMDLIVNELNKDIYKSITDVRIFALETLTFNRNFLLPQGNVSIISPQWILSGDPHNAVSRDKWMIDLKGKDAQILAIPQAENAPHSTGQDGKDGSPGKPGQSGGNFFGIGDYFFDGILTININGGKGGDGQHGGHGDNGKDGIDADLNAVSTDDKDGEWETEGSGIGIWHKPSQKYCYKNGVSGGKGGNGGKGGEKGQGGLGGESILIRLQELQAEKLNGTQGSSGDEGRAGHYGTGGKNGKKAIAEYYYTKKGALFFRWKLSQRYPDADPNPTHALSGFSPSEKDSEGQVQPSSQNTINIPEVINSYKIFWRESINQLEKPEYQHNIMIQAQKDLLKSFLQKLEDHSEVKKKSNSSSFAKELTSLEEQYVQLKELNFLPHYKSFLFRIKEYAHDTSQLAPADQKALRFLQTTTLSRICHLQAVSEPSLVTDIPGFLKFIKKNIQIFEELEKEKQIDFYKEEYQQHIVPKIQEANDFIKLLGKEVKETNDTLNNHINKLMKEIKDLKEKKIEEQKDLIQKQEDLRKAMPLKMFLNVLSLGTKGLGFLGETGKMVGGLFDAGLGGIRSGFLPSSSDQDKLNAFPKAVDNMINIVQQSANELSPETSTQQSVIEERLNEQALYFNQGTGEWAAFKVNYEKIKSPQVKEEILKNLEKDTKHNKSSKEKQKVILEKAKVSVDVALAGVNFYNEYKSDQSQMEELSRAIKKSKEELKKCEVLERKVSEEFTPYVEEVKKTVSNFQNNQDKSSVALDVQKWNIRKYLMNVQDVIQDFTEGFNVEKDFRRSLEKMKGALETVLQLYERIQNFQDQMTLASYVANLQTPYFSDMPKEEPLHSELLNLKKMTNNYIILERYAKAINAVQQWAFPFESYFVGEFENLHFNKTLSTEDTVNRAIGNLGKLEDRVEQYETTIVNFIDKDIVKSDFRLKYKGNRPFFTWNFSNYEREIKKVLQGEEVILKAEIFPNTLSAVKFNKMELALSHSNSTQDASLQEMLKNYRFTLTHQGDSFYKWKNQTYKISSGAFKISCHFERMKETQEPNGCNPIYEKLAGKYYLLSPYAYWAIGIEPSEQLSDSDREFYKQ